jgi:hypothetical protein
MLYKSHHYTIVQIANIWRGRISGPFIKTEYMETMDCATVAIAEEYSKAAIDQLHYKRSCPQSI